MSGIDIWFICVFSVLAVLVGWPIVYDVYAYLKVLHLERRQHREATERMWEKAKEEAFTKRLEERGF